MLNIYDFLMIYNVIEHVPCHYQVNYVLEILSRSLEFLKSVLHDEGSHVLLDA